MPIQIAITIQDIYRKIEKVNVRKTGNSYGTFEIILDIYIKTLNKCLNKARVSYEFFLQPNGEPNDEEYEKVINI